MKKNGKKGSKLALRLVCVLMLAALLCGMGLPAAGAEEEPAVTEPVITEQPAAETPVVTGGEESAETDAQESTAPAGQPVEEPETTPVPSGNSGEISTAGMEEPDVSAAKNLPAAQADEVDVSSVQLSITDDIKANGVISVTANGLAEGSVVNYQWEKSTDGTNWTVVEREKITTVDGVDYYNISEDTASLNVAFDEGAQAYYRVSIAAVNGVPAVKSNSSQTFVDYYSSLQNGSFESPAFTYGNTNWTGISQLAVGTSGLVWKTTAGDQKIELANATGARQWYGCNTILDGKQIAELNCESAGALYQDVLTTPGSTMYWQVSHRGRSGTDTMCVVIMPTNIAETAGDNGGAVDTQAEIEAIMSNPNDYPGVVCQYVTSDNKAWNTVSGSYTVPSDQYLTRYYFVAVEAAGGVTQGNLLDNVWFSTELPPPVAGETKLQIRKVIEGDLTADEIETLKGTINFTYGDTTITGNDMDWSTSDGNTIGVYSITEVAGQNGYDNQYKVTENTESAQVEYYSLITTVQVDDETQQSGNSADVQLKEKEIRTVTFTNTYEIQCVNVTVKKIVKGNMGDTAKEFDFTYSCGENSGNFKLAHNGSYTIENLPIGSVLTITEGESEYTVAVTGADQDGRNATVTVAEGVTVTFTNTKEVNIDTGISLDTLPYVLLLGGMAVLGGALLLRRKVTRA